MEYVVIAVVAVVAAFIQASVGFGYALLFAPVAALVIAPSEAIAVSIVGSTTISVFLYAEHTPRASFRSIAPMSFLAVATTPLGLWLLAVAEESLLRLLIGLAVLASAVVNLTHPTQGGPARADHTGWQMVVGALSGVMRGAVSMGGPPVILYQHWVGGGAAAIRSRMFAFFVWTGIPAIALAAAGGIFTREVWLYALVACLALPFGILLGRLMRPSLSDLVFARLSMGLLGGTAAIAVVGAGINLLG